MSTKTFVLTITDRCLNNRFLGGEAKSRKRVSYEYGQVECFEASIARVPDSPALIVNRIPGTELPIQSFARSLPDKNILFLLNGFRTNSGANRIAVVDCSGAKAFDYVVAGNCPDLHDLRKPVIEGQLFFCPPQKCIEARVRGELTWIEGSLRKQQGFCWDGSAERRLGIFGMGRDRSIYVRVNRGSRLGYWKIPVVVRSNLVRRLAERQENADNLIPDGWSPEGYLQYLFGIRYHKRSLAVAFSTVWLYQFCQDNSLPLTLVSELRKAKMALGKPLFQTGLLALLEKLKNEGWAVVGWRFFHRKRVLIAMNTNLGFRELGCIVPHWGPELGGPELDTVLKGLGH